MQQTETGTDYCINASGIPPLMENAATLCLKHHIPFVLYRAPGEKFSFFSNPNISSTTNNDSHRFRIIMWNKTYADAVIINNELNEIETIDFLEEKKFQAHEEAEITPWPNSTSYSQYETQISNTISNLKKRSGKTVISRVITEDITFSPQKWLEVIGRIFNDNPTAMCCLYYTSETGAWICASPELLLDANIEQHKFYTIALAGTRRKMSNTNSKWSDKDIMEHRIVKDFIGNCLTSLGSSLYISETETYATGEIEHLRTVFEGNIPNGLTVEKILDNLNPTPALCGYPTDTALKEIKATEIHLRYCYGGYISIETTSRVQAFVNIRCAHFNDKRITLYAGSGIMPESTPEGEWVETEAKFSAIGKQIFAT